ncbi:hypothetical protein V2J09_018595 [Rumex salicifolius]
MFRRLHGCGNGVEDSYSIGDRRTSDVVVRVLTPAGRDEWVYCHYSVLVDNSKYFSDRLSDNWPTCKILDARNCVEVNCEESDFDYHITVLRLLYDVSHISASESWHGVKNALGILKVATELGCPEIIASCVEYLEAMPWEEAEEEEILQTVPSLGSQAKPILARLQPVEQSEIVKIYLSGLKFATSSPPPGMNDLKSSVQEQLEYLLTEDDDAPLLESSGEIKFKTKECMKRLLSTFVGLLESLSRELKSSEAFADNFLLLQSQLSDLLWACQILSKFESMRGVVTTWIDISTSLIKVVDVPSSETKILKTKLKVIEVTTKILEAIAYGTVILEPALRLHMVKVWLPFVRATKPEIDAACTEEEEDSVSLKVDTELWPSLESAFVSMIAALPSAVQAEILTEWLGDQHVHYPDLTEAFEVWCYRSKVAKKRMASFGPFL